MKSAPGWLVALMSPALALGVILALSTGIIATAAGPEDGGETPGTVFLPLVLGVREPQPPHIEYLRAVPESIDSGECSLLEWGMVTGASSVSIEPVIGGVATPGSQTVCPTVTTVFRLTATGPGGTSCATAMVTVEGSPVPPEEWDSRLDDLGVRWQPAIVGEDEPYWRLVKARWADPVEAAGLHHIFLEVLDEGGQRVVGQSVVVAWPDGSVTLQIEDKPPPEFGANFPMPRGNVLGTLDAWVGGGEPSDQVVGMGLGTAEYPDVNFHTCFYLTFQWVPAPAGAACRVD